MKNVTSKALNKKKRKKRKICSKIMDVSVKTVTFQEDKIKQRKKIKGNEIK